MISQPTFFHFSLFLTALGLGELIPVHSLMLSSNLFFCLPCLLPPFHCTLQDDFGQTWWMEDMAIPLQFASLYDDQVFMSSDCLLNLGSIFLLVTWSFCMRCLVPCSSTSFPWFIFSFAALLWESLIHKCTGKKCDKGARQSHLGTERYAPVIPNWFAFPV